MSGANEDRSTWLSAQLAIWGTLSTEDQQWCLDEIDRLRGWVECFGIAVEPSDALEHHQLVAVRNMVPCALRGDAFPLPRKEDA